MHTNASSPIILPSGRTAVQHRLTGMDEEYLLEVGADLAPAQWTTVVLTRCLAQVDGEPISVAAVEGLTVGDREALLLHLHRQTLGEKLACVFTCPACGEALDVDMDASALLLPPTGSGMPAYRLVVEMDDGPVTVDFRLPTGADQAAISLGDVAQAAQLLLERCVIAVTDGAGESISPTAWPREVIARVDQRMADLDPQAEMRLNVSCPACSNEFQAVLDMATFLRKEIADRAAHLYAEVHLLAFYYHWGEAEILGLPTAKRRRYLELLESALSGESFEESAS